MIEHHTKPEDLKALISGDKDMLEYWFSLVAGVANGSFDVDMDWEPDNESD